MPRFLQSWALLLSLFLPFLTLRAETDETLNHDRPRKLHVDSNGDSTPRKKKLPAKTHSKERSSEESDESAKPKAKKSDSKTEDAVPQPEKPASSSSPGKNDEPPSDAKPQPSSPKSAQVTSFATDEIAGFDDYAPWLQALIEKASALTHDNLTYTFGSSDPKSGGMDCSGAIFHVLQECGMDQTPRQSDEMCRWIMKQAVLHRTEQPASLKDPLFSSLKPGDLLFWSGTYETNPPRDPPITHVMLYLGTRKTDGKAMVFGSSDGRRYDGQRRCGVSVFDFILPKAGDKITFYGYGEIPHAGAKAKSSDH